MRSPFICSRTPSMASRAASAETEQAFCTQAAARSTSLGSPADHRPRGLLDPLYALLIGVRLIFLDLGEIVHAGLLDGMAECLPADFVRFPAVSEASWAFHGGIPCLYCACRLRAGYGDKRPMK